MDQDRWDRLQRLFHDALERPAHERDAFLEAAEPDAALREEVRRLLAADEDADTVAPDLTDALPGLRDGMAGAAEPSLEGRRIGPYRLVRRIGQGGMGAVYLARREDVDKQVALKLVRGALGAPELVQRFLLERRVLARLEHPRIARLLDAGFTEDGTPWFAMEYVEGEPLTEGCEAAALPRGARLRLFRHVCDAVSYAHSNLVVHRDIKPSNVLVTAGGEVKLLDFGIAKLLGADDDETLTRTGGRVMSPAYAAPEQLAGDPVTTATDVFSLGVLLHEVVTGRRPAGPPGEAAVDTGSGDLDAICLKAMAPEPERRYRSAEQLGDDVTRLLTGLPVEARRPTFRYRAGKFLRRHAAAVAMAAVLALSLGGGLGAALWQGQRAERSRQDAEAALARAVTVTDFLTGLFRAADPRESRGEEITARELLERGVARADELSDDPPLQADLLQTLAAVDLQLGRHQEAADLMTRAVEIRRALPPDEALVSALNVLGRALSELGHPDSAAAVWTEALEGGTDVLGPDHETVRAARSNLAVAYSRLGRDAEAEAVLRDVVASERRVDPGDANRAYALNNLAIQLANRGGYDEAVPLLREALDIWLAAEGEEHPGSGMLTDNLGMVMREAGRYEEAEPLLRGGLGIRRRVLGDEHRYTGESLYALGTLLALRAGPNDLEEADSLLRAGLDIYLATLGADHPGTAYLHHSLGLLGEARGDLARAEDRYRQALDIRRGSARDNPFVTVYTLTALSRVLRHRGSDEALEVAREAVALAEARLARAHPNRIEAEAQLGLALAAAGDRSGGGERFAAGVDGLAAVIGSAHPRVRALCSAGAAAGLDAPVCGD